MIHVDHWHAKGGSREVVSSAGFYTTRVKYRGALWDVELAPGEVADGGQFLIQEIRNNRLIVVNHLNQQ